MKHEPELIQYVASGLPEKSIADKLNCSRQMVQWHIRQLRIKYGAVNNANLVNNYHLANANLTSIAV